jgi:RNA polymerase sigma-70 factor, ECF subfamily
MPTTVADVWAVLGESVRRFVSRRVRDPHAAEDITQDVMLKTHARLASSEASASEERLPAWVFTVARNAVVDHYRSSSARPQADLDDDAVMAVADDEQERVTAELSTCMRRMVAHLPEPYREALTLADLDGLSQQEVAGRTGLSLSGAKSRVQRARRQLHDLILDCCRVELDRRGGVVDYETTERTKNYCGETPSGSCDSGS